MLTAMAYVRYTPDVETIPPDEGETIDAIIAAMGKGGEVTCRRYGRYVRVSHAKSHALLRGELHVRDDLPPELAQGLFAKPGRYSVVVRMAQVPGELLDDRRVSTPRGLAIKVLGVEGEKLPGHDADTQDFVLDTGTVFNAPTASAFLAAISATETATALPQAVKAAVSTAARVTNRTLNAVGLNSANLDFYGHPRLPPLAEAYFSQCPLRYGDHVAKLGFFPDSETLAAVRARGIDFQDPDALRTAMVAWFTENAAEFDVRVQLCTDLERMPVEDASVDWPQEESPYRSVARLVLPPQPAWNAVRRAFVDEQLLFCPSHSLAAHRPLGSIMRARLRAYEVLGNRRRATNGCPLEEPKDLMAMPQEIPSAAALASSSRKSSPVPGSAGVLVVGALAALVGAAWFRSRKDEAALRERTAERLRTPTEVN
ncbi:MULTISPECIES: catalase family protein [Sphingomonas]|uniref:catalase family protein n=1 Tax=Sphingomonas TaxID=13687 RepID=UPI0019CF8EEF|nr:catalase family protein [Sphingomonas sp. ABOLF]GLK22151.1 catalase [Microbacterium terregens]